MFNPLLYNKKYHDVSLSDSTFLVTGGAGFIGSNLVEYLVKYKAKYVRVIDDLSNGKIENIQAFIEEGKIDFIQGDIRDLETCISAMNGIHYVFHLAALGSVPRSINDPCKTNDVNVSGFVNVLYAAKESRITKRFIYAASSSTYGDSIELPKREESIGKPLSPYAVSKLANEMYADIFSQLYGIETVGLRYFNVFGPKQSPDNAYASVIPLFIKCALNKESPVIYGDGLTSRDFTFIENVIQANIKAIFAPIEKSLISNVACGQSTTLSELWTIISNYFNCEGISPKFVDERVGDIKHSLASLQVARKYLNYNPLYSVDEGINVMREVIFQVPSYGKL